MTAPTQSQLRVPATAASSGLINIASMVRANEVPPALSGGNSSLSGYDLAAGDTHVWRVDLLALLGGTEQLEETLSIEELNRAQRFHFAADRRHFVLRRAARRYLIGRYLNLEPSAIRFLTGNCGKPGIAGQEQHGGLRFSCSHSGDLALITFARGREIGVDLEQRRPLPEALQLAHSLFAPAEISELAKLPATRQQNAFFDCWTRKEAFVKALGLGLSFPLDRFTVSLGQNRPAALLKVEDDPNAVTRWRMQALDVGPNYSATLVHDGCSARIQCFEWKHGQV